MKSFFDKEEYTLADIQWLIDNHVEENIHLEFKDGRALGKDKRDVKLDISADVSAFANSDGGIIIYGVGEKKGQAAEFGFVDAKKYSKDWLTQVIDSCIFPRIKNIQVYPIQSESDPFKQVLVVKILRSNNLPHQAMNHLFHKRNSSGNSVMEEWEVRQAYSIQQKTELKIDFIVKYFGHYKSDDFNPVPFSNYEFRFKIQNTGNSVEHHYKIKYAFPSEFTCTETHKKELIDYLIWDDQNYGYTFYSISNQTPLFPGEVEEFGRGFIIFFKENMVYYETGFITVKLYYSGGVIEERIYFKDHFKCNGESLLNFFSAP